MRSVIARATALVFAFSWLFFPGFGLIDLMVTWDAGWPQVLEAGWGLFFTVFVGAGFVAVAASPQRATPVILQLYFASAALAVSVVLALEFPLLVWAAAIGVETALVSWLASGKVRRTVHRFAWRVQWGPSLRSAPHPALSTRSTVWPEQAGTELG